MADVAAAAAVVAWPSSSSSSSPSSLSSRWRRRRVAEQRDGGGGGVRLPRRAWSRRALVLPTPRHGLVNAVVHVKVVNARAASTQEQQAKQDSARDEQGRSHALQYFIKTAASSPQEIRSTASLRAHAFANFPEGRSVFSIQAHKDMKSKEEACSLSMKLEGKAPGFQRVACVLASVRWTDACDSEGWSDVGLLRPSVQYEDEEGVSMLAVGSLDVNLGLRLPGEELVGDHPQGAGAAFQRAYISNVCVLRQARRRGIATALLDAAQGVASSWDVRELYVHVVADNAAAHTLYMSNGFVPEKEESSSAARLYGRPRRILLRKQLKSVPS